MALPNCNEPKVVQHDGVLVVRDDLFFGGTKARYAPTLYCDANEVVYASPCEGGAQTALAATARALGKRATVFCAHRQRPHPRTLMAKQLGARIMQCRPGYLSVVAARAREYAEANGATLTPFGFDVPGAHAVIAAAAVATGIDPDEVWCAAGSGTLARALARAWPRARRHVVQVGRSLTAAEVDGATVHVAPIPFGVADRRPPPFPSDPHYDAKAWWICKDGRSKSGRVVFWNVTGPAAA